MTTQATGTAAVDIVNSHTSGGGNFYVSGLRRRHCPRQHLRRPGPGAQRRRRMHRHRQYLPEHRQYLHRQRHPASRPRDRGCVRQPTGVSHITVTGNTFNNINAVDGAIAFQRFTDGRRPTPRRSIGSTTSTSTTTPSPTSVAGWIRSTSMPDYFGAGAVLPAAFHDAQLIIGTSGADIIVDASTGANAIFAVQGTIPSPVVSATIPSPAARATTRSTAAPAPTR